MSIISRLVEKLYGLPEARLLLVGLDSSGRTTALYRLKLGEIVTTIPTIGFNVESVQYSGTSYTLWDVGGCDKIRPLWRHYFANTQALIWFVDSSDRERLDLAQEELQRLIAEDELAGVPLLVWASKQDLPGVMTPEEVSSKLGLQKLERPWTCIGCSAFTGEGLFEGLQWISEAIKTTKERAGRSKPVNKARELTTKEQEMEALLQRWLEQEDEPDEEFLAKFRTYELDTWDHRTHLRIAWLYLTREGRREGLKLIFEGIRSFIANSPRTARARGTTFHETMTYFWVHMVHYAMVTTSNPDGSFRTFLLLNPQLANGGMFLAYYSKKLMLQTPEARTSVVLPDKAPLPSLISNVNARASLQRRASEVRPTVDDDHVQNVDASHSPADDGGFLASFEAGKLDRWNHECLLRVIFLYLVTLGRAKGKDKVLAELQRHEGAGFHLTINYFWIQMVDFARASWEKRGRVRDEKQNDKNEAAWQSKDGIAGKADALKGLSDCFEAFRGWCLKTMELRPIVLNSRLYLNYYSEKVVFDSTAAKEVMLPNLKSLPNLL